jgi:hypothetical protein
MRDTFSSTLSSVNACHRYAATREVVWCLQKSVLSDGFDFMSVASVPLSFLRAERSTFSRNAAGTRLMALSLELAMANCWTSHLQSMWHRMPGLASLFMHEDCDLCRLEAARDLCPALNPSGMHSTVSTLSGEPGGEEFVGPMPMGIPLEKGAKAVLSLKVGPGSRARRGNYLARGQCKEVSRACMKITRIHIFVYSNVMQAWLRSWNYCF